MVNLPLNLFSSTFIILLSSSFVFVNGDCLYSRCATNMGQGQPYYYYYSDPIPFPFRTPDEPLSCGLPGFDLGCNNFNRTPILSFPSGQSFKVELISNSSKYIKISDPQSCLPQKLMQFNSSGTPFYFMDFTKFTFYTCPLSFLPENSAYYRWCDEIGCLRGQNRTVVCKYNAGPSSLSEYGCEFVGDVNVAGAWSSAYIFSTAYSVYLTWDTPDECLQCESRGEDCRRDPNNFTNIKCFARPSIQTESNAGVVLIVVAAIALPILFIVVSICYIRRINRQRHTREVRVSSNVVDATTDQNGVETIPSTNRGGLEQATLDTYPIIEVGDSGRVLMYMEDKICPICLSEYEPRDMIKSLPECLHRFHSGCIDEWLYAKAICPVCRTMPPQLSS